MAKKGIITGDKKLDKALKTLEGKVQKRVLKKAMRGGMKIIQSEAKQNAPVKTGQLKKAIKVRAAKRSRKTVGVNVQIGEGDFKGETFYAAIVEYGSKNMPAKGYMRRAFDSKGDEAKDYTMENTWKLIEDEAQKSK